MRESRYILELPYAKPPLSLNDRGQTKGARQMRSRIVAEVKADVVNLAKAAKIGPQTAIHVRLHWRPPTRHRRDPDNLVATLKPCIDALVVAGIVPDDCPPFVDWSAPRIHPPAEDRQPAMWLTITTNPLDSTERTNLEMPRRSPEMPLRATQAPSRVCADVREETGA